MIVGWSLEEKRVIDAVEDYLDNCAEVMVTIDLVVKFAKAREL